MGNTGSGKRPSNFKLNIGDKLIDKNRDLVVVDRYLITKQCKSKACNSGYTNRSKKYYSLHCNKCNVDFEMEQNNLVVRKDNCPCCSNKKVFIGVNNVATVRPDLVKYFKNPEDAFKYTIMSNVNIEAICPDCNSTKIMKLCSLSQHGIMCIKCGDGISYPNKYVISLLNQLHIDFETEKTFEWINNKRYYDCYIKYNNKTIICENMGMQHYQECNLTTRSLNEEILNDKYKMDMAIENGIDYYIVLDCRYSDSNYIKNSIMSSKLPEIFNFLEKDVNWEECDLFATKSLTKEICFQYDKLGKTISELSKEHKLNRTSIRNYLIKGTQLNICNYLHHEDVKNNKIKTVCEFKNANQNLDISEIAEKLGLNKYVVRDCLIEGFKNGLCVCDISNELIDNKKISANNLKSNPKKPIYIYDFYYNFFGKYESGVDAIEQNPQMNWTAKGIQKVCSGFQKTHRNYIFSYIALTV